MDRRQFIDWWRPETESRSSFVSEHTLVIEFSPSDVQSHARNRSLSHTKLEVRNQRNYYRRAMGRFASKTYLLGGASSASDVGFSIGGGRMAKCCKVLDDESLRRGSLCGIFKFFSCIAALDFCWSRQLQTARSFFTEKIVWLFLTLLRCLPLCSGARKKKQIFHKYHLQ